MSWKIEYNEETCIGCGACTVQCPENWELAENDKGEMKARLLKARVDQLGKNKEAEEVCPMDCIKVIEE